MKNNLKNNLFLAVAIWSLFSCVRAEKDQSATRVTLNIPADFGKKIVTPASLNSGIVPSSLSEINCFATLVSGPEAGMNRNICEYKTTQVPFTVGKLFGGFFKTTGVTNASMSFSVPNGNDRLIRLIGFKVDTSAATAAGYSDGAYICSNFLTQDALQNFISDPYILSEQGGIKMKGEDLTLDIAAALDPNLMVGDCSGPDFPKGSSGSSGGAPYQFGLALQDGLGIAPKKLSSNSCVGLRVQIQDSSGNRANLSSNPTFIGKIHTDYSGNSIGTFYKSEGVTNCAAGTQITPVSGDITFSFKNGTQAFNDFVMYFQPTSVQGASGQISVTQASGGSGIATLQPATLSFDFDTTGGNYTVRYALYDLFSNRSTLSSQNSSNPITVKPGECRPASIQFEDSNGVPMVVTTSVGSFNSILVSPTTAVQFYSTSSDCSVGSSTAAFYAPINAYTPYGSYNFYYKVPTSTPRTFSFSISNFGAATSIVSSGDISNSTNFWVWEN